MIHIYLDSDESQVAQIDNVSNLDSLDDLIKVVKKQLKIPQLDESQYGFLAKD